MAVNQKAIFVYDDFSTDHPVLMGSLYVNVIKGGESYSFEYDKEWLKKTGLGPGAYAIFRQTVSDRKEHFWPVCRCFSGPLGTRAYE